MDIGVGVEGLIHLSELSNEYISDARKVLRLGQWVLIKAIKVDQKAKKLSFSKTKAEQNSNRKNNVKSFKASDKRSGGKKNFSKGHKKGGGGQRRQGGKPQSRGPKTPFNNPFGALKDLKQ